MLYVAALVLVASYPLTAMAAAQEPVEPVAQTEEEVATTPSTTVTSDPPKVSDPESPKLTYSFDEQTQKWNSEKWQYNPTTGSYEPTPAPIVVTPPAQISTSPESSYKTVDTTVTAYTDVQSTALSGNALISGNTAAGNALTGDASAVANVMNVVNSSVATGDNQKIVSFTKDIMGDVKGDIMLYPLILKAMLEAEANKAAGTAPSSTTINATTDVALNNTINLAATSGNAAVTDNTKAGDATSGSATAMANVINILNSLIAAQNSFIGTINIYGSLEGDILVAPDFLPQLLASNGSDKSTTTQKVSTQDTATIVNNISAVAESGAASVFGNTQGGNATTGVAESNVVLFNVTGHDIVAEDSLLVFINVLGKWVGLIIDAPQGATAAMLGTGVKKHEQYPPDLVVNSESKHGITNTIALSATSGDAVVAHNTQAGNATSGAAKTVANVANIMGSNISLSGWLKVLFINIHGDWWGDFGLDTAWGNTPAISVPEPTGPVQFIPAPQQPAAPAAQPQPQVIFVDSRRVSQSVTGVSTPSEEVAQGAVLSATDKKVPQGATAQRMVADMPVVRDYRLVIIAGSALLTGVSFMGLRRLLQS